MQHPLQVSLLPVLELWRKVQIGCGSHPEKWAETWGRLDPALHIGLQWQPLSCLSPSGQSLLQPDMRPSLVPEPRVKGLKSLRGNRADLLAHLTGFCPCFQGSALCHQSAASLSITLLLQRRVTFVTEPAAHLLGG